MKFNVWDLECSGKEITLLVTNHFSCLSYEPELFPGLIYKMVKPQVVLLIFASGKVVLTGKFKVTISCSYNIKLCVCFAFPSEWLFLHNKVIFAVLGERKEKRENDITYRSQFLK